MSSITLTQFTDPNCTWSWGSEPIMRRIETLYGDQLTIEFVLGGLIEDFDEFYDAANDISDPSDVAPHWETASERHGMPVDADVWHEDPPRSTYPASIATKAAEIQDPRLGLRYLRRLRELTATERVNIEKRSGLIQVAEMVGCDVGRFIEDLDNGSAQDAFEADLRLTQEHGVRGFPSFRIEADGDATMLGGFQTSASLENALTELAPDLQRRDPPPVSAFITTYGYVATKEVAEVYGWDIGKAEQVLKELAATADIRAIDRGNGTFWMPVNVEDRPRRGTGELSHGTDLRWADE